MKIQNFEILEIFGEKTKFQNCHSFFQRKKNRQKIEIFWSQFFSTKRFRIFFDENVFDPKFFEYLFRSQIFQRFQKSHLEQRAILLKIRTARTKKKDIFSLYMPYPDAKASQVGGSFVQFTQENRLSF